jgi:hypothetical protein
LQSATQLAQFYVSANEHGHGAVYDCRRAYW